MAQISDQQFKELYKQFQKLKNNLGTDEGFAKFLNEKNINPGVIGGKITGIKNKTFTARTVSGRRQRLDIKTPLVGNKNPKTLERVDKIDNLLKKEIAKANASNKYISQAKLSFIVEDKLGLPPKSKGGGSSSRQPRFVPFKEKGAYPIISQLDSEITKLDNVIKDMLIDKKPLNGYFFQELSKRTGLRPAYISELKSNVPSYKAIADQGADALLPLSKGNHTFLKNLSLSEQLESAIDIQKGQPVYTGMTGRISRFYSPGSNVLKFAKASWNLNQGQGDIKFFLKGKPVEWQRGLKLPVKDVSFTYDGKLHKYEDFLNPAYTKKYFPEVYKNTIDANKFKTTKIDNPFKPGSKINVNDLIKKIQVDGYNWNFKSGVDILHGPNGVKNEPFTNLRYNTKDINKLEAGLSKGLEKGNITKTQYNQSFKNLNKAFQGLEGAQYDQAIIDRVTTQAGKIKKGTFYGYETLRDNILKLNKTDVRKVCRALGAFNVGGDVAGCAAAIEADPIKAATAIEEIKPTSAALGKVRNAATTFLKFAGKGKTFAVTAGVGAGAGALVKAFRNDDPETYLTNDKQANAMILDTADQLEREERQAAVGDAPELLDETNIAANLGVTAAAIPGSKKVFDARKKKGFGAVRAGLGPVGKALSGFATPLGIAATTPLNVASQVYQGDSAEEILTDPLNYLGPAFAETLTKEATAGMPKGGMLNKALRLGMSPGAIRTVSRAFGLPGLALSLGYEGYDQYKKYTEGRGFVYNLLNKDE